MHKVSKVNMMKVATLVKYIRLLKNVTVIFLNFQTGRSGQTSVDQDQTATVCHSVYIFWTLYSII